MRKTEYDELTTKVKANKEKLKEVTDIGATNQQISDDLAAIKKEIASIEKQIKPFKESGAKMVTEAEL